MSAGGFAGDGDAGSPAVVPGYPAPARQVQAELRDRGSRFLAVVDRVDDEAAARSLLDAVRAEFPDATHHCWAWRLGDPPAERSSDDGEPAGTAGLPMLQVLRGAGLSDVLAVVVRWYGGTKLGKGGLARAYGGAVGDALEGLVRTRVVPTRRLRLKLPYELVGAVKRLVHPPEVELVDEAYGEAVCLELAVWEVRVDEVRARLADLGLDPA